MSLIIDMRQLFGIEGKKKILDYSIHVDELSDISGVTFGTPVAVKGYIENRAGVVTVAFSTEFTLNLVCDRCAESFSRNFHYDFSHTLVRSLNTHSDDFDEYIVCEGDALDMNEVAVSDLLLELPSKILCKEDCKGLCMKCGCNLNETQCDCPKDDD